MSKIVLIDGHSILNRAFFGLPDLTNAEGLHTNAIYGFLNIMFKILEEEKPEYLTVAFDVHAPTFRHKMFEAYKGTRKPMAEELRQQVPLMKEVLHAMGIRTIEQEGLEADVVTLALAYDVDEISQAGLIDKDWIKKFPNNSAPYTSTIVFLVRKGNPKQIHDWNDLTREDVQVVTPNPKTSGGARWNYLAAWAYASDQFHGDEGQIKDFMKKMFSHVVALDSGARGATTSFVQRGQGDVLIAWENEALLSVKDDPDKYEVVIPSISILAEPSVAVVDEVVDRKGTRKLAEAYINYLYSPQGQEIAAKNFYRPRDPEIAAKYASQFPALKLVTIDDAFGGWAKAQKVHFADGGSFDQIYEKQ